MPLTDTQLSRPKPEDRPCRNSDGGGLFVEIRPNDSKLWRLAYRYEGSQQLLSLGAYPTTSLASACIRRRVAKTLLADSIDPLAQARAEQETQCARRTRLHIADNTIVKKTSVRTQ